MSDVSNGGIVRQFRERVFPSQRLRRENIVLREINNFALANVRCDAVSPGGGMLCDREPGHTDFHANWRGAEWNNGSLRENDDGI